MTAIISSFCGVDAFDESPYVPNTYNATTSECFNTIYIGGYLQLERIFYDIIIIELDYTIRDFFTRA